MSGLAKVNCNSTPFGGIPTVCPKNNRRCFECQLKFKKCTPRRMLCCGYHFHDSCLFNKLHERACCPSCKRWIRIQNGEKFSCTVNI